VVLSPHKRDKKYISCENGRNDPFPAVKRAVPYRKALPELGTRTVNGLNDAV
jgi:hypothetical protein